MKRRRFSSWRDESTPSSTERRDVWRDAVLDALRVLTGQAQISSGDAAREAIASANLVAEAFDARFPSAPKAAPKRPAKKKIVAKAA